MDVITFGCSFLKMAAPSNSINKCPSKSAKSPQTKQCNRGKVWSDVELGTFLDIWASQEIQNKLDGTVRNKAVFLVLTAMMNERGFIRTSKELQNKIKNLKRDYKKTIDHNKRSGVNLKTLPHMDKLDNIIGKLDNHNVHTSYDKLYPPLLSMLSLTL